MGYILNTYYLLIPYFALCVYFYLYGRDNFFVKTRSSIQYLFVLFFLGGVFLNLLVWKAFFYEYDFLDYNIRNTPTKNKIIPLVTIMSAIAAVCGWIFTSRVQTINSVKSHSMQVLMNSRTSTIYNDKVDIATKIKKKLKMSLVKKGESTENLFLSPEKYSKLTDEEKSAVHYMLNYLEFVAIGIRHYNLDEDLLKGSLRTIVNSNYILFHKVIEHLRLVDNPNIYTQLELLHKRWALEKKEKCSKCKTWHHTHEVKEFADKHKYLVFISMSILTSGIWIVLMIGMNILGRFTRATEGEKYVCNGCVTDKAKN